MSRHSGKERKGPAVLFVCTANICRSPMAAALFIARLKKVLPDEWQTWTVDSAGTWAEDGHEVSRNSALVLEKRGLSIADHHAKTVTLEMLKKYDLILTMEPGHKEALQVEFPSIASRVYMLSEMEGALYPISDPYGGPLDQYEAAAGRMERIFDKGMVRIIALTRKGESRFEKGESSTI